MLDRAIGVAGVALTAIFFFGGLMFPNMPRWLLRTGLVSGVILFGVSIIIAFLPQDGNAQAPGQVIQGPGSAYSYG